MLALAVATTACESEPGNERRRRNLGGGDDATGNSDATGVHPGDPADGGGGDASSSGGDGGSATAERAIAAKLGLPTRFAVGLGNDAEGADPNAASAFTLGPKVDIHYMYLSGLGWPAWSSPEGLYVTSYANAAKSHGVVPMFTLYQAAAWGEANLGAFNDGVFMTDYWKGVRVLFQKLADFGAPAIVHLEPDFWGYAQQKGGDDPSKVTMKVGSMVPECASLPETVAGLGRCMVKLARTLSPKVVVGLSASSFGAYDAAGKPDPARVAAYLAKVGGAEADIVVVETLDRDAGCYEKATDPKCQRSGTFWWDESNVTHPNFQDHIAWAKTIRQGVGRPLLWWQMPLGAPSPASGGTAGQYRDNRVRYLFAHPQEFAAAGAFGAVFGAGAENQTTVRSDGDQFKNAVTGYLAAPAALP